MRRDIVDDLFSITIKRYHKEYPEETRKPISNKFADRVWYSIKGIVDREGEEAARKYVLNCELLSKEELEKEW